MVMRVSLGGQKLRLELANNQGVAPVRIGAAHVAIRNRSSNALVPDSDRVVKVSGQPSFNITPGAVVISDPVDLTVAPLSELVVSLYLPEDSDSVTVHELGLHTTYIADGDTTAATTLEGSSQNKSYFWLTGIDVLATEKASAVIAFGDSITDGFATTPDTNRAWPAVLAERLLATRTANQWSVLNLGISGNRLLHDGAGTNALARFDRDVLSRPGARTVLLLEGINDISFPAIPGSPPSERVGFDDLIAGYEQFIAKAHLHGLEVIGATILPWEGVWTFNEPAESLRQRVNEWIRASGAFDAVVDFDAITRDPAHLQRLLPEYDSGDHVHPNDAGNEAMARAVDLTMIHRSARRAVR
jgi:lysophospholipase L1-like esterase